MKLEFKSLPLQIFVYITRYGKTKKLNDIKRDFASTAGGAGKIDSALAYLVKHNYLNLNNDIFSLSGKGEEYLEEYNQFRKDLIFNNDFDGAVIAFLYEVEDYFPFAYFPGNIKKAAPSTSRGYGEEFQLLQYLNFDSPKKYYYSVKNQTSQLNEYGRAYYEHLIQIQKATKDKDEQATKKETLTIESLQLNVDKISLELGDYKKVRRQSNIVFWLGIISFIISIAAFIISLSGHNKP